MNEARETTPWNEGFLAILAATWRELPAGNRRSLTVILVAVVVTIGNQIADDFGGRSLAEHGLERVVAHGITVATGTLGALLLSLAYSLHSASQKLAGCSTRGLWASRKGPLGFESLVLHRWLLALPTLGSLAGVLLSTATGMLIREGLGGRPRAWIGVALYGAMLLLTSRTVTRTTRFLYRHAEEQAEAAAAARAEATEAQLTALQAQMNPHFLFNALNTVASLVRTDPKTAEKTVESLAGVLRRTLDRSRHTWRTVGDEVDYLEAYLAVEQERWGDRLRVEWSIAPELRPIPLPPMTLQPLVENALKHGLGNRLAAGTLKIGGEKEDGTLRLTVADDGAGFPPRHREGTGLGNLRRRLATLYGDRARLEIESSATGAVVRLTVPATGGEG